MKENGFKITVTLAFLILCGFYLYPSVRNYMENSKIAAMADDERIQYEEENNTRLRDLRERSLKLGLDLLGGMHVTLEVRLDALIRELATDIDPAFNEVLAEARAQSVSGTTSMIETFGNIFAQRDPEARLSRYFRDDAANITRRSSNDEVLQYLQTEADEAVQRAIEIIRQRVDRFGVSEPAIQRQGTRRIVVELPGVDDAERVRSLLRGTARLEFRLMTEPDDVIRSLQQLIEVYEEDPDLATADTVAADSSAIDNLLEDEEDVLGTNNKFLAVLQPLGNGVIYGTVSEADTAKFNALMKEKLFQDQLPANTTLMLSSESVGVDVNGFEQYYVLGVRKEVELDGSVITDARVEFDEVNRPEISMTMNAEGARTWSRLTGANVGRNVSVVLDNVVYSFPTVIERIPSGRTSINNLESREEAQDIVTVLKSGALPAPVDIVEERTVGPSLGAASIQAGLNSVLIGLLIVALFMVFYYRTAGFIADIALVLNVIFILGILAAFGATLTLPGIAGIVLTIGMAVDANVLIFERVREEQNTGKTLKAAIDGGYSKALSAIFDSNITTFFVGLILYSFGVGPIQGFAVTLMAGIASSLFSAIVISRIFFDWMVNDRRMNVSFG
ncbi:MAG: protein translocase subunit SecD [Rhodothermales bacterium]